MKHSIKELVNKRKVLVHGRTANIININRIDDKLHDGAVPLFWTGAALEFNVSGSEIKVSFYSDYSYYEQWIAVVIDGSVIERVQLDKGVHTLVYSGLENDKVKNIRFVKEVQAMSAEGEAILLGLDAETDGEFLEVKERELKLEFIGDSITSGEGSVGEKDFQDWVSCIFSAVNSYSYLTADALNADYRVISQSGWGLLCGWDGNPYNSLIEHYTRVCSLLWGEKLRQCGCDNPHDFSKWQPDVVVMNLGTNDHSAFKQPEWKGEHGETFNLRMNEDGSFNKEDVEFWMAAAERALRILRNNNPKAHIIWAYGMLGHDFAEVIENTVNQYKKLTGDEKAHFLLLPDTTDETVGSRCHPGRPSHEAASKVLVEKIREVL